ncbi:hypothetical protein HYPSUDRAFT_67357 [Hypholoma sublateritium FD-334 SS-4]|uniref:Uncharacterized protein n=1 Tax=Hypholoma sublateritium (strain FD-334 SS-4) TaxID=945553 RepID=A0A0D2MEM4_HYPSF|nr:hypothetical protein HYPSUDRAFT_67357 [Hypholoma sublateritium FD-334 SS-4]
MFASAKDVEIEGSTLLTVAHDYIHNEHHYQSPEIVINVLPPAPAPSLPGSISHFDEHWIRFDWSAFFWSASVPFLPEYRLEVDDLRAKLQQRIHELQKKRRTKDAERTQTRRRKPSGRPPPGPRSTVKTGPAAHGASPPSSVIYSTDPAHAQHSHSESDADKEGDEQTPHINNTPFPLNSYTSADFRAYEGLYENPPDTNEEGVPNREPHPNDFDFEAQPPIPPVHSEYWHACNAWYAWYAHCMASWQASCAAWMAAVMSWSPPWLGMCAPSWLGAWAPWR